MNYRELNHGAYKYDPKTKIETICGMKIIDVEEQIQYITSAMKISEPDLIKQAKHRNNYNLYEVDDEIKHGSKTAFRDMFAGPDLPVGYCKKTANLRHGKRYSVSPWVSHNCVECLAKDLVHTRDISPGVNADIEIEQYQPKTNLIVDIKSFDKLSIKLTMGRCEITMGRNPPLLVKHFSLVIRDGKPLIIVGAIINNRTNEEFVGKSLGILTGIHICETILTGGKCRSFEQEYGTRDFMTASIPVGYSSWYEIQAVMVRNDKIRDIGKIWIHRKCKRCTASEPIISPIKLDKVEMTALDVRDRTIQALISENQKLREDKMELLIKVTELEMIINQ